MLESLRADDCVWDVGANIGYYTTRIAQRLGPQGKVVAFEPGPIAYAALKKAIEDGGWTNVVTCNIALSRASGEDTLALTHDAQGATNYLVGGALMAVGVSGIRVQTTSADDFANRDPSLAPTVIKIDVEGHEDEVLFGMRRCLTLPALRLIFVEIHFTALESKGAPSAPRLMVRQLAEAGFVVSWLDTSHLVAQRAG
jgi:FkbM family methyltransferase